MFECILFGYLRFSANWFFHCTVNCWFKYHRSSSVSGRIYNSSPNPRIQTMPFIFTHIGISCLTVIDIIPMLFLIFLCFQKLKRRKEALKTVRGVQPLEPSLPRCSPMTTCPRRTRIKHPPSGNAPSYPWLGKAPNCAC